MSTTTLRNILGNAYNDIHQAALNSEKYKDSRLEDIFDQRFYIQNNRVQMIADQTLTGYQIVVNGNEIYVSLALYNNPDIIILNSVDHGIHENSRKLFKKETFSTISYLICDNYTLFQIGKNIKDTITVRYKSDYESFYCSTLLFVVDKDVNVNIIEEYESRCSLNNVVNYILNDNSQLNLKTYYKNNLSAQSHCLRTAIVLDNSIFKHTLINENSSKVLDECKIICSPDSQIELKGKIKNSSGLFHSIIQLQADIGVKCDVKLNYRSIIQNDAVISIIPIIDIDKECITEFNIKSLIINKENATKVKVIGGDQYIAEQVLLDETQVKTLMSKRMSRISAVELIKKEFFNF